MRKKLLIAAIAAMCFSCTACGFESDLPEQQEEVKEEAKKETPQVNEIEIVELPSVDAPSYLEFASEEIAKFYNELWEPQGTYVVYPWEAIPIYEGYTFLVRYQQSDEEIMEEEEIPVESTHVLDVFVNETTGEVIDFVGAPPWQMAQPPEGVAEATAQGKELEELILQSPWKVFYVTDTEGNELALTDVFGEDLENCNSLTFSFAENGMTFDFTLSGVTHGTDGGYWGGYYCQKNEVFLQAQGSEEDIWLKMQRCEMHYGEKSIPVLRLNGTVSDGLGGERECVMYFAHEESADAF